MEDGEEGRLREVRRREEVGGKKRGSRSRQRAPGESERKRKTGVRVTDEEGLCTDMRWYGEWIGGRGGGEGEEGREGNKEGRWERELGQERGK